MATELVSRMGDGLRALRARLQSPELKRFFRFGIVGGSGVVVNEGFAALGLTVVFAGVASSSMRGGLAIVLGIVISIFTNFVLNDGWTWGDRPKHGRRHWFSRLGRYYLVSSIAGLVQWGVAMSLHTSLDWHVLVTNIIGIGAAILINYHINNRWTFREVTEPAPGDRPE